MSRLKPGATGKFSIVVDESHLASTVGNIGVDVLATPMITVLFESAATDALLPVMKDGEISVGTRILVRHFKPTPPGLKVEATVKLREVAGIKYLFDVEVYDEVELVADGEIERAIIDSDRFYRSVDEKRKPIPA